MPNLWVLADTHRLREDRKRLTYSTSDSCVWAFFFIAHWGERARGMPVLWLSINLVMECNRVVMSLSGGCSLAHLGAS